VKINPQWKNKEEEREINRNLLHFNVVTVSQKMHKVKNYIINKSYFLKRFFFTIQGVIEMRDQILTTNYWLHVEYVENILKILSKIKMTFFLYNFFLIAFSLLRFPTTLVGKISAHFKNTPCLSYFIKRTPMRFPCFKAYFLEVTSHWRTFYKI
jgi:hypothetical protein